MLFGILNGKRIIATIDVSDVETVKDKKGNPIAYRERTPKQMFEAAKAMAQGARVFPINGGVVSNG